MRPSRSAAAASIVSALLLFQSCSSAPQREEREDPAALVRAACTPGEVSQEVSGSVWMKAKSREASGQFPAIVQAKAAPPAPFELRLEVTQLLGARAALIEIRGKDFKVETPRDGTVNRKASSWGGIPLDWAAQLFLDRFPCPAPDQINELRWSWLADNELLGRSPQGEESWKFRFRRWNLKPWVESVLWERSPGRTLEVKREDPDPSEGWAHRWEAASPSGAVKVRWKERRLR